MSRPSNIAAGLALALLAACAGDPEPELLDEPELTAAEVAQLPAEAADHHEHDEARLVAGTPEDDASTFDDDAAELRWDEPVTDDDDGVQHLDVAAAAAPLLKAGLHPRASDGLRAAGVAAWRITQTVGSAPASAGVHLADGTVNGKAYTAAVDISTSGMTEAQIKNLLERMAKVGFAAWYRKKGRDGWNGSNHIHGVYANCKMKAALRSQVRSWLVGRNGLVSNTVYTFHKFSATAKDVVKAKWEQSKQGTTNGGAGFSARVSTAGAALTIRASASTSSAAVGSVANGAWITITCQKNGSTVTGTYGTSKLWDRISGGFVSDAYVYTGSDGRVAPTCP